MTTFSKLFLPTILAATMLVSACSTEETDLGLGLQDPSTHYYGQRDTLTADQYLSVRDDSLRTSGYQRGIVGNYSDTAFGSVTSVAYTQVALSNTTGITFDENTTIDSVVLSLVTAGFFPAKTTGYNLHFEVKQLASQLYTDTIYFSTDTIDAVAGPAFYDARRHYNMTDSVINLRMSSSFHDLLRGTHSTDEFLESIKGLRIRILSDDSDPCMVTINWAATGTLMTVYYHFNDTPGDSLAYTLKVGNANHFTNFTHNYDISTLGADSVQGRNRLYLEPLGGYNLKLRFDEALRTFAAAHPYATVHFAELLLPTTADSDTNRPSVVTVMKYLEDGSVFPVTDKLDGTYDTTRHCYRLRLSTHLQSLLREGRDNGMLVCLDTRRHDARRTIIAGPAATDPVRIEFIYTE
ncbi:MAG: DUF4270 domain-containing protein [Bacteroidales bacterium]|nr:DUF4270 domain-containing protein [Bacteroidales bacterium]